MKADLIILILTLFFIINAYQDNKYTTYLKSMKKYYTMTVIGFAGLSFYLFMKKYPAHAFHGIGAARQLLKSLPIDKSAGYMFEPIFQNINIDFSKKQYQPPNELIDNTIPTIKTQPNDTPQKSSKRSVSETKKKYIASQQGWKCGHCQSQLNAWFEVDHKHSLETGGTNHVSNLVALCRECHGKKTAMERMGML
jgi:hypothetical protein